MVENSSEKEAAALIGRNVPFDDVLDGTSLRAGCYVTARTSIFTKPLTIRTAIFYNY